MMMLLSNKAVGVCRPIVILAERDKLAMDAELEFILRGSKIKVITREGQPSAFTSTLAW